MECIGDRADVAATGPRVRANLCAQCQWGGEGCTWNHAEFAHGGWRRDDFPRVRVYPCENYSARVDDPATR